MLNIRRLSKWLSICVPVSELFVNRIRAGSMLFYAWYLLFRIMFLKFMLLLDVLVISFIAELYSFLRVFYNLFTPWMDISIVSSFWLSWITCYIYILCRSFFGGRLFFISLGTILRHGMLDCKRYRFSFYKKLPETFPKWLHHFTLPLFINEISGCSTFSP